MGTSHNNSKLDLDADLQEPDEDSGDRLVGLCVNWSRIRSWVEEVHGVRG